MIDSKLLETPVRMLDIAPKLCFSDFCRRMPEVEYFSTDLDSPLANVATDLTRAGFRECAFDIIVCFHVLEHIPEDGKAMREIWRLLRPGGTAIIQVPLSGDTTIDGPELEPAERARRFGQEDHVRIYGSDIAARLRDAGLVARLEPILERLPPQTVRQYALEGDDRVIIVAERLPDDQIAGSKG